MINNNTECKEQIPKEEKEFIILPHPTKEYRKIKSFLKQNNLPRVNEAKYANALIRLGLPNGGKFALERLPLLRAVLRT